MLYLVIFICSYYVSATVCNGLCYCCGAECTVEADEVQGKCHVVFGEEIDDLDSYFLEKPDVFWFSEVISYYGMPMHGIKVLLC